MKGFEEAGCPSCNPINSVRVLKRTQITDHNRRKIINFVLASFFFDPTTHYYGKRRLLHTLRRHTESSIHYCRFSNLQILTYTFKIATSFFSTASSLCGKRSLSMTFIATSLFVDLCKPVAKPRNDRTKNKHHARMHKRHLVQHYW